MRAHTRSRRFFCFLVVSVVFFVCCAYHVYKMKKKRYLRVSGVVRMSTHSLQTNSLVMAGIYTVLFKFSSLASSRRRLRATRLSLPTGSWKCFFLASVSVSGESPRNREHARERQPAGTRTFACVFVQSSSFCAFVNIRKNSAQCQSNYCRACLKSLLIAGNIENNNSVGGCARAHTASVTFDFIRLGFAFSQPDGLLPFKPRRVIKLDFNNLCVCVCACFLRVRAILFGSEGRKTNS